MSKIIYVINKMIKATGYQISSATPDKYNIELEFWKKELINYRKWYNSEISEHYGEPSPTNEDKIRAYSLKDSAILTWFRSHQKKKYIEDLSLEKSVFWYESFRYRIWPIP